MDPALHASGQSSPARTRLPLSAALIALVMVTGLAAADGGYRPTAWGWAALGLAWALALAAVVGERPVPARLEVAVLVAWLALLAWTLLSVAWSESVTRSVLDAERTSVYVLAVALALVLGRRAYGGLLVGAWLAIVLVSVYSLATRLFPDRLGVFDPIAGYRLSEPIGYWNGLGAFAAIGALLALGLADSSHRLLRLGAAASTVVVVPTLYFTFSRGAWIALAVGLLAAVAVSPARLRTVTTLLVIAPWPALAVAVAARSDALTERESMLADAADQGHRLALVIGVLSVAAALLAAVLSALTRVRVPVGVRRAYAALLVAAAAVVLATTFARFGAPPELARDAYSAFTRPPPAGANDLNRRLFTLSAHGRDQHWEVAWDQYRAHPWLGSGAGTYELFWVRDRPSPFNVRDAHSLYLEALAELGPLGAGLLLCALVLPLAGGMRARAAPIVPGAVGAYTAFLAHAAGDWDWELPAVTLAGVLTGVALLKAASGDERPRLRAGARAGVAAGALALAAFAATGLVSNGALAAGERAVAVGDWAEAEREARQARRWAPWSSRPWRLLGDAQRRRGDVTAARRSFRAALDHDPHSWEIWLDLGLASDGAERRAALRHARRLNPLSPLVRELAGARRTPA